MRTTEDAIARTHERVANLRREQAHQLTTHLTRTYGVIGVETLAVANLARNRRLARRIADAGWGTILSQLAYKSAWTHGSLLVQAGRFHPSSKTCSSCGSAKAKLGLEERVFTCAECGHVQDRDHNAAVNLAQLALRHARAKGLTARLAPTGGARGGQVRLAARRERSPVKREEQSPADGSSRHRKVPAIAA
jgi:putative transposase